MKYLPLFFISVFLSYSQTLHSPIESSKIEQLLLEHRFTDASQLLEQQYLNADSSAYSQSEWVFIKTEVADYRDFFVGLKNLNFQADTAKKISIAQSAVTTEERYLPSIAGNSSYKAFQLFVESYKRNDFDIALQYYRLANVFKGRFFSLERFRLREGYEKIRTMVAQSSYQFALQNLDSVSLAEKNNPTFGELKDSLKKMQSMINDKIHDLETEKRKYSSREIFDRTFSASAGVSPMFTAVMPDISWNVKTKGTNYLLHADIGAINPAAGYLLMLQLNYHYSSTMSQQLRIESGSITYSSIDVGGNKVTINLDQTISAFSTVTKYSFSDKIGLRSFVSGGFGYMTITRKEQQIYFADLIVENTRFKEYSLLEDKTSSPTLIGETGLEYFSGSLSNIFFDGTLGLHYITKSKKMISPLYFSLAITAGVLF